MIDLPPAEYAQIPRVQMVITSEADPDAVCRNAGATTRFGYRIYGCASLQGRVCQIVIPLHELDAVRRRVLLHEMGHCLGWKHQ